MNYFKHFCYIHLETTHKLSYLVLMCLFQRYRWMFTPTARILSESLGCDSRPSSPMGNNINTFSDGDRVVLFLPTSLSVSRVMVVEVPSWKQTLDFYSHQTCLCRFLTSRTIKNNFYYLIGESGFFSFVCLKESMLRQFTC